MVPLLTGLLKETQHRAHGTSLAVIIFAALASFSQYWIQGNVDWPLVGVIAIGSTIGALFGARAMSHVPSRQLRYIFTLYLVLIAVRLFIT